MNINIKTFFMLAAFLIIASIGTSSYFVVLLQKSSFYLDSLEKNRHFMYLKADELRQSSEDLTRFAREYVVTKNKSYKDNYFKIINIRDGKSLRPENYHMIYWDLNDTLRFTRHKNGDLESIIDEISKLPYSKRELKLLKLSKLNSDNLAKLEIRAFKLVETKIRTNERRAIKLLFSQKYKLLKQAIMLPIDEVYKSVQIRIDNEIILCEQKIDFYFELIFMVFGLGFLIILLIMLVVRKKILKPILWVSKMIKLFKVNKSAALELNVYNDEIGNMVKFFYEMQDRLRKEYMLNESKRIALIQSEHRFKKLFDYQKNITIISDGTKTIDANLALYIFLGIESLDTFYEKYDDLSELFIYSNSTANLKSIPYGSTWIRELKNIDQKDRIISMKNSRGKVYFFAVSLGFYEHNNFIVSFTDISSTLSENMDLSQKLEHDKLTGTFNREFFYNNIDNIIKHSTIKSYLSVTILDIDFFKSVNDTKGHDAGDRVLIELCDLVESSIRDDDYLVRWGGEEFILLMKIDSKYKLITALEHLRKKIELNEFTDVKRLTCSFGVSIYKDDEDIDVTIKRADLALYDAKNSGRNKVSLKV